ncbi:MAG: peptidyl-prolyl cis-trans isomerase [Candidatus Sumerlaeota bacterium]|nr:peptidyl-prolyl cis-trans isomerase [Candidatus Sumerlaeota bacterium]
MTRSKLLLAALAAALLLPAARSAAQQEAPAPLPAYAHVGEDTITRPEIDWRIDEELEARPAIPAERRDVFARYMHKRLSESLIEQACLYEYARANGLMPSEDEIQTTLEQKIEQRGGEEEWKEWLDKRGLSLEDGRHAVERWLAAEKVRNSYAPTEEEIAEYFEKNKARLQANDEVEASHILIGTDPKDSPADKEAKKHLIEDLRKRIEEGEDFAALAREHSTCPSASKGGSLGKFKRGAMVKPFEEAAFALKPGELSDIVETQFGYHIIKVTDRKYAKGASLDDWRDEIVKRLKKSGGEKLVKDIRAACEVEYVEAETPAEE